MGLQVVGIRESPKGIMEYMEAKWRSKYIYIVKQVHEWYAYVH